MLFSQLLTLFRGKFFHDLSQIDWQTLISEREPNVDKLFSVLYAMLNKVGTVFQMRQLPKYRFKKKITESLFQIVFKQNSYLEIDTLINEMKRI